MKIGGRPFWFNPHEAQLNGRYIASFTGVSLAYEVPFPWTNESDSILPLDLMDPKNYLLFRDGCCINFAVSENGTVNWEVQFS